jgi:hypothetical protein
MHDVDKVGVSEIGDLVLSKNKKPANPFPEGQTLVSTTLLNFFRMETVGEVGGTGRGKD